MICWLRDNANLIQAIAAIFQLVLAAITLAVLVRYANDTKTISKETTRIPFLSLFQKRQGGSWFLRNDGHGAAVNIRTQWIRQKLTYDAWKAWNPLGVGDELHLIDIELPDGFEKQMNPWAAKIDPVPVFLEDSEFNVIYESLSGITYRSRFTKVNGQLHAEFSKAD